jgi:two-component system cell cycle sensor histidine kinase/response regulator CckA
MDSGKQIQLSTYPLTELPADLVLLPVPASRYVAVSVEDSGCGIPPENLPRIFEPFFTTKALSTRRGTGLGLSMAYELAKKLGAGLSVASVVGQGSTFTLILPVRELTEP